MKLYRNTYDAEHGSGVSSGSEWFASRARALAAAKASPHPPLFGDRAAWIAEPFEIEPTRAGVIRFLNQHAGHPDNG